MAKPSSRRNRSLLWHHGERVQQTLTSDSSCVAGICVPGWPAIACNLFTTECISWQLRPSRWSSIPVQLPGHQTSKGCISSAALPKQCTCSSQACCLTSAATELLTVLCLAISCLVLHCCSPANTLVQLELHSAKQAASHLLLLLLCKATNAAGVINHLNTAWLTRCQGESRGGAHGRLGVCWAAISPGEKCSLARPAQQLGGLAPHTPDKYVALRHHHVCPSVCMGKSCFKFRAWQPIGVYNHTHSRQ